jgi:hypothetical protein
MRPSGFAALGSGALDALIVGAGDAGDITGALAGGIDGAAGGATLGGIVDAGTTTRSEYISMPAGVVRS